MFVPVKRLSAVVAAAALVALGAAGCGSDGKSDDTASPAASATAGGPDLSKVTLKVAVFAGQGYDVQLKAAGLDKTPYKVQYATFQDGGSITRAVAQGTVDLGPGSAIANTLLTASGGRFTSVGTIKISGRNQDIVVPKGSTITDVAGLRGKKVAYIPNSTSQYVLLKQLESAGLSFADITPVPLDPATSLSSLLGGKVDAYAAFGPTETVALKQGGRVLAPGREILNGTLGALVGSENVAPGVLDDAGKAAAVAEFIARINTGAAWARTHPDAWAAVVAKATGQPEATALANFTATEKDQPTVIGPVLDEAVTDQQTIADEFLKAGVIKKAVDSKASYSTKLNPAINAAQAAFTKQFPAYFQGS